MAETPPVTTPVKTEQAPEVKAPEAPNGNTATPATPSETTEAPAENTATTGAEGTEAEGTATPEENKTEEPKVEEKPAEKAPEPAKAIEKKDNSAHGGSHGSDEHAFTVENMWKASSGPVRIVLGTLLFMLVAACGIGLERLVTLMTAKAQSRKVAGAVGPLLLEGKTKEALQACRSEETKKSYLGRQLNAGLTEFAVREDHYGIDAVERAIDKHSIVEIASLRKGLNVLATVGSTAPFVGLVGTILVSSMHSHKLVLKVVLT